jgi:hypothetical protein
MENINNKNEDGIVDFLFEAGMLAKSPRSGFFFLGSGNQSIAERTQTELHILGMR